MSASAVGLPVALAITAATSTGGGLTWFVPFLVAAIAYFHYELTDPESRPLDIAEDGMLMEYDFIVIGAGSAGEHNMKLIAFWCGGHVARRGGGRSHAD